MSQAFNRINRAMGFGDLYPFEIVAARAPQARVHARHRDAGAADARRADRPGGALGHGAGVTSVARGQRVIGAATHYVENQPPVRTDIDEYALNAPLVRRAWRPSARRGRHDALRRGRRSSSDRRRSSATRRSPTCTLRSPTRTTAGASGSTRWSTTRRTTACSPRPSRAARTRPPGPIRGRERDVARAAMFMLFAQVEPGHACPVSMTHAAVASIKDSPWVADDWLPRMYSRDYEPRLLPERGEGRARSSAWR